MTQQDDFDRGVKNRRAVLGDAYVAQSLSGTTGFNAEFQSLVTRYAWHDIWGRPGLDHTTRRLLVLGMTMALARWEEFELHCRATVQHGVPLDKIKEALMQGAIYCGVPAANTAFKITSKILREEGLLPAAEPLTADVRVATHHTFSAPQIKLRVQGQGAPVVMSHALGLDGRMWDALASSLASGHEVLRFDHRGHGGSAVPAGPYRIDDLVDDAARVIREWGRGPVVFVGLSMGGMVAQGLAIRHPELVKALVLANTTAQYPQAGRAVMAERIQKVQAGGLAAIEESVIERFFDAPFRAAQPDVVRRVREVLQRTDATGYAACCHAVAGVDWLARLGEIRCPTLVIAGAEDVGTPVAMAQQLVQGIAGATLEVIAAAAHLSVLEQPAAFEKAVRGLLARL